MANVFGNISEKIDESTSEITQALEMSKRQVNQEIKKGYEEPLKKSLIDVNKRLNRVIVMQEKKLRTSFSHFESTLANNLYKMKKMLYILTGIVVLMILLLIFFLKQIMINQELQMFYIDEKQWVLPKEMRTKENYNRIHKGWD